MQMANQFEDLDSGLEVLNSASSAMPKCKGAKHDKLRSYLRSSLGIRCNFAHGQYRYSLGFEEGLQ